MKKEKHEDDMQIYSIIDKVSVIYGDPFISTNNDTAIRSFSRAVNDPNTTIHQNPGDYELMHLGAWNHKTGNLLSYDIIDVIATGDQLINPIEE